MVDIDQLDCVALRGHEIDLADVSFDTGCQSHTASRARAARALAAVAQRDLSNRRVPTSCSRES